MPLKPGCCESATKYPCSSFARAKTRVKLVHIQYEILHRVIKEICDLAGDNITPTPSPLIRLVVPWKRFVWQVPKRPPCKMGHTKRDGRELITSVLYLRVRRK